LNKNNRLESSDIEVTSGFPIKYCNEAYQSHRELNITENIIFMTYRK
jgi:hypothetical protein